MTEAPLLRIKDLTVTYKLGRRLIGSSATLDAVRGVSFDLDPGSTLGLVGESGSGKSTTGRAILRLVQPSAGTIEFAGEDISRFGRSTPLSYRKDVQVIFQEPRSSLNPRQTIGDTLAQVVRRHQPADASKIREQVLNSLDQVGLGAHHVEQYPRHLSGGQCQRVAIARALIVEPRLIICDEPVSALDVSTQGQVINLLMDLQQDLDVSYLFIAHDLTVVRHVSSMVGVMYVGRLVEYGSTDEIYSSPSHPYTQILLDSTLAPNPREEAESRQRRMENRYIGEPISPLEEISGCPFNTRCPLAVERCREERPELRVVSETGRLSACHFAEVVSSATSLRETRDTIVQIERAK